MTMRTNRGWHMADENEPWLAFWLTAFSRYQLKSLRYWDDREASYEGSGCAIAETVDGKWLSAEYSHCSCDGPEDTLTGVRVDDTLEAARRSTTSWRLEDLDRSGIDYVVV